MADPTNLFARLWVYQRERFPLMQHGPLIAAFSFCAVSYSAHLRGGVWPSLAAIVVAFLSAFGFFLQLRLADEFKDAEEDARWRSYRPVPRGLVSLRLLGWIFVVVAVVQALAALYYDPRLIIVLLGAWIYLAAMSKEFFVRRWLTARPIMYLWTHMLIMPIVDFYATASDWMPAQGRPPAGLIYFLSGSFCCGVLIEFGRKIRAPQSEEEGVPTYSKLWGPRRACVVWAIMGIITAGFGCAAGVQVACLGPVMIILALGFLGILMTAWNFYRHPENQNLAKRIEVMTGVWTLLFYLSLGILPALFAK